MATTAVYLHVVVDRLHGVVNKLTISGAGSLAPMRDVAADRGSEVDSDCERNVI
jgi:hypothetical protein